MVSGRTRVCFLLGYPLGHSRSPLMHNAAFATLGMDYVYVPVEVKGERLSAIIAAFRAMENFGGANVTVPHKIQVMEYLDGWSQEAEQIGAVNTLVKKGVELWGENTDAKGFLASLREEVGFDPRGKRVMLLGAGGAARAVLQALVHQGAERIDLVNRTLKRARELASLWDGMPDLPSLNPMGFSDPLFLQRLRESHLLVNSTSVGLSPRDPPLFDYRLLPSHLLVCDLIYEPAMTALLEAAQKKGCTVLNGLGMLIHQGALSFEIWTGRKAPVKQMRETLGIR